MKDLVTLIDLVQAWIDRTEADALWVVVMAHSMNRKREMNRMNDLISRQAAIDVAIEAADDWDGGCSKERERFIRDALEELPSARPEIIHCKDCKFYGRADKRRFYRGSDCLNKRIDTIVPDRDFCSRAERRCEA